MVDGSHLDIARRRGVPDLRDANAFYTPELPGWVRSAPHIFGIAHSEHVRLQYHEVIVEEAVRATLDRHGIEPLAIVSRMKHAAQEPLSPDSLIAFGDGTRQFATFVINGLKPNAPTGYRLYFFIRFDEPVRRVVWCKVISQTPPGGGHPLTQLERLTAEFDRPACVRYATGAKVACAAALLSRRYRDLWSAKLGSVSQRGSFEIDFGLFAHWVREHDAGFGLDRHLLIPIAVDHRSSSLRNFQIIVMLHGGRTSERLCFPSGHVSDGSRERIVWAPGSARFGSDTNRVSYDLSLQLRGSHSEAAFAEWWQGMSASVAAMPLIICVSAPFSVAATAVSLGQVVVSGIGPEVGEARSVQKWREALLGEIPPWAISMRPKASISSAQVSNHRRPTDLTQDLLGAFGDHGCVLTHERCMVLVRASLEHWRIALWNDDLRSGRTVVSPRAEGSLGWSDATRYEGLVVIKTGTSKARTLDTYPIGGTHDDLGTTL